MLVDGGMEDKHLFVVVCLFSLRWEIVFWSFLDLVSSAACVRVHENQCQVRVKEGGGFEHLFVVVCLFSLWWKIVFWSFLELDIVCSLVYVRAVESHDKRQ